jgi:hypothetical protein
MEGEPMHGKPVAPSFGFGPWKGAFVLVSWLLWAGALPVAGLAHAADGEESGTPTTRTFQPRNLGVTEAADMLGEMSGIDSIVADAQAGTIEVQAPATALALMDSYIRVFDTEQPKDAPPRAIRVFRLEHLSAREAVTLLRSQLQVTQAAVNPALQRVAVRDTAERLEAAAKLIEEADVAGE